MPTRVAAICRTKAKFRSASFVIGLACYGCAKSPDSQVPSATTNGHSNVVANRFTTASNECRCYCGGADFPPGATACLGGFKHQCNARGGGGTTQCGWDQVGQQRCDDACGSR